MTEQPGTATAATSAKGKAPSRARSILAMRGHDWRFRIDYERGGEPTGPDILKTLRFPSEISPEKEQTIPSSHCHNATFHRNPDVKDAPWTGYFAHDGIDIIPITNAYGMWVEIERNGPTFRAVRRARKSLRLCDWPVEGIDESALDRSATMIPMVISRPSQFIAGSLFKDPEPEDNKDDDDEEVPPTRMRSSRTTRGHPPPRGNGDDFSSGKHLKLHHQSVLR